MNAPARGLALAAGAAITGVGAFRGFTVRETAAAVASFRIWDNATAASGRLLATVSLAANASEQFETDLVYANGLFVEIVAGTVEGSIFFA
jgi:hypothetical protein